MEIAEMKRLLNEAKSNGKPIGCAVGLSKDAKTALILMHRSHQGPEVGRNLKAATPDIVNMRFGTAQIDVEDHKLVRLVLNRPVTGIAKKLIKTLKGTGFNKVKLGLEDGTEMEGAADEEQEGVEKETEEQTQQTAPPPPPSKQEEPPPDAEALKKQLAELSARIATAASGDATRTAALVKLAREGQVNIATNNLKSAVISLEQLRRALEAAGAKTPTTPPTQPPSDLLATLTALTKRIPEVAAGDPPLQGKLVKLVTTAQGQIKANDTQGAMATIQALREAMETASPTANQQSADAYRQSGREWLAARQTVEDELDKLRATIAAAYDGQSVAAEIEKKFREVTAPVLRTLDSSFATKLEAAGKAADAAQRQTMVQDAKNILKGYESFVQTGLLADLDDNPFVPLSLRASLTGTISQLTAALG
jgi:hypothetical protein